MKKTEKKDNANILLNKDVYDYIKLQKDYDQLVVLPEGTRQLAYEYLRGWYDGAREVMKIMKEKP